MDILNFGSLNIDYVYDVERFVSPGETMAASGLKTYVGGKGLNQSVAIARAGSHVYHAGMIGQGGDSLKTFLSNEAIDASLLNHVEVPQGTAIIQVTPQGENAIIIYGGSNLVVDKNYIDSVIDKFSKDTILVLQNEISNVPYIIDKAKEKGMTIVFNPSPITEDLLKIDFSAIDYLIINEIEGERISQEQDIQKILDVISNKYPTTNIVLTMGKNGVVAVCGGKKYSHQAYEVKVIDTTAAGDTFMGYFVDGISRNHAVENILSRASMASAISVSKAGATNSIPHKNEVLKMEKEIADRISI